MRDGGTLPDQVPRLQFQERDSLLKVTNSLKLQS